MKEILKKLEVLNDLIIDLKIKVQCLKKENDFLKELLKQKNN